MREIPRVDKSKSQSARTVPPHIAIDNIPLELRLIPHWVNWKTQDRGPNNKPGKCPMIPRAGLHKASPTDRKQRGPFKDALLRLSQGGMDGLSYILTNDYFVVDLDHVVDRETGKVRPPAQNIIDRLNSYTELSPSGDGVHVWIKRHPANITLSMGTHVYQCVNVEIYCDRKAITMTGRHLAGTPTTISQDPAAVLDLYRQVTGDTPSTAPVRRIYIAPPAAFRLLSDDELLEKMRRESAIFDRLYRGDTSDFDNDHSRADLSCCARIARRTANDYDRIDRLFRRSGLMREKWNIEGYRKRTIERAITMNTGKTFRVPPPLPKPNPIERAADQGGEL